jgi:hypothetical protein
MVARRFRRNRKITITTRQRARKRVNFTSLTDSLTVRDRSLRVAMSMEAGIWGRVSEPDRRAVAIGHHEGAEAAGIGELSLALHRVGLVGSPENTGGKVHVAGFYGAPHLVDPDGPGCELLRVELDPDRVFHRPIHLHLRHALDGREPLGQKALGVLVELG